MANLRYFDNTKQAIQYEHSKAAEPDVVKRNDRDYLRRLRLYHKHLGKIADRLGPKAYNFFRWGWEDTTLHDAYVLSLSFGDALNTTRLPKLTFENSRSELRLQALNYEKTLLHTFTFKGIRKLVIDIPSANPLWYTPAETLGHIYSYEVTAVSPKYLRCEWLLDSGGTIAIEFQKLNYGRKRFRAASKYSKHK